MCGVDAVGCVAHFVSREECLEGVVAGLLCDVACEDGADWVGCEGTQSLVLAVWHGFDDCDVLPAVTVGAVSSLWISSCPSEDVDGLSLTYWVREGVDVCPLRQV